MRTATCTLPLTAAILLTACDLPEDAYEPDPSVDEVGEIVDDEDVEEVDAASVSAVLTTHDAVGAYGLSTSYWPSHVIPVCWENPTNADLWWRALTQAAVEETWQRHSALTFTGWGACVTGAKGIRIRVSDERPHVVALGKALDGVQSGMFLNMTFAKWSTGCAASIDAKASCVRKAAIHEFGHAVGFSHEQNRPDKPGLCPDAPLGSSGDVIYGPFDKDSVMSDCTGGGAVLTAQDMRAVQQIYGARNDVPLAFDVDGDGIDDPTVWRPSDGTWRIFDRVHNQQYVVQWGTLGDIPVVGDFDGDYADDFAVFRPSTSHWHIRKLDGSIILANFGFGARGDVPLRGNVVDHHHDHLNVWRPQTGMWYARSLEQDWTITRQWGGPGDQPLVGNFSDYGGLGYTDPTVWRFSTTRLIARDFWAAFLYIDEPFGATGDIALAANFGGDNLDDLAVWSPSTGSWRVRTSDLGAAPPARAWGAPGDIPLAGSWDSNYRADYMVYRPSTAGWYGMDPATGIVTTNLVWGAPLK